jgi:multicomponent Na+:H+ antiporter subunit E
LIRSLLLRAAMLAFTWWVLTGSTDGWVFGSVAVLVVAILSLRLTPPAGCTPRLQHVPGFLVFFLLQSLRAGCDVALRTLTPRLPLHPEILNVPLALPAGPPTWMLMLVVSLLPGTLSTSFNDGTLELHCLDNGPDAVDAVREVERHIARLFGCAPTPRGDR